MSKKKHRKTHKQSVTAKGSAREIELNIVTWLDLMAYGNQIAKANFDPSQEEARLSLDRLRNFQEILNKHAARNFNIFSLNDGAVISRDFSPRAISVTFDFIKRSIDLYVDVFESDKRLGNIGPRAVIACGFRARSKVPPPATNSKLQKILHKLAQKEIPVEQAVIEAN